MPRSERNIESRRSATRVGAGIVLLLLLSAMGDFECTPRLRSHTTEGARQASMLEMVQAARDALAQATRQAKEAGGATGDVIKAATEAFAAVLASRGALGEFDPEFPFGAARLAALQAGASPLAAEASAQVALVAAHVDQVERAQEALNRCLTIKREEDKRSANLGASADALNTDQVFLGAASDDLARLLDRYTTVVLNAEPEGGVAFPRVRAYRRQRVVDRVAGSLGSMVDQAKAIIERAAEPLRRIQEAAADAAAQGHPDAPALAATLEAASLKLTQAEQTLSAAMALHNNLVGETREEHDRYGDLDWAREQGHIAASLMERLIGDIRSAMSDVSVPAAYMRTEANAAGARAVAADRECDAILARAEEALRRAQAGAAEMGIVIAGASGTLPGSGFDQEPFPVSTPTGAGGGGAPICIPDPSADPPVVCP